MKIDTTTSLYMLLGDPVHHSLSPLLYNAAFQALRLNSVYLAAAVKPALLGEALSGLKALNMAGANITSPHKEAVLPFLDEISPEARRTGSVNTIINRGGVLYGETTDGPGFFRHLLEEGFEETLTDPILIIGSGGAARSVAQTLALRGAVEIVIANRTPERARTLSEEILKNTALRKSSTVLLKRENLIKAVRNCRLLVYCLPTDVSEIVDLIGDGASCKGRVLFDLRYNPPITPVMQRFADRGGAVFNGKGMLFWQAVSAFELFTKMKAPVEVMRRAMSRCI